MFSFALSESLSTMYSHSVHPIRSKEILMKQLYKKMSSTVGTVENGTNEQLILTIQQTKEPRVWLLILTITHLITVGLISHATQPLSPSNET